VVDVNAYEDLPTGKTWVSMAFSGDLVAAPYYLSKGLDAEVLRYWFPLDGRGTVGNDLMTVLRSARNPVLAHHFLNFLLDFDMAMLNLEWNGFQPPQVRIDPALLVEQGYIPANLTTAVVRQEYFETGFRAVELDPRVDKSWHGAWSQFKSSL
jgi:spermidine/putrescine transport system substrate-binding protein